MPFDEENTGNPFEGDFPGRPDHEPWGELAAGVHRQVSELAQRRHDPSIRHERLRMLQQRRRPRQAESPAAGAQQPSADARGSHADEVTQFDFLPAAIGFDSLLVRGELLITTESY